jgi:hypothetical protein
MQYIFARNILLGTTVSNDFGTIVTILTAVVSTILSALLVHLYRQQKDILKEQKELTESNQRALLRVLTYRLYSWTHFYRYSQEEIPLNIRDFPEHHAAFIAYVTNPGKGYIDNLWVELQINTPSHTHSTISPLVSKVNTDQLAFSDDMGGIVPPEQKDVQMYSAALWFEAEKISDKLTDTGVSVDRSVSPTELLWMINESNEEYVNIGIFIHYRDGTGVREPIQLLTSKSQIEGYQDITKLWREGSPGAEDMEPLYSIE